MKMIPSFAPLTSKCFVFLQKMFSLIGELLFFNNPSLTGRTNCFQNPASLNQFMVSFQLFHIK